MPTGADRDQEVGIPAEPDLFWAMRGAGANFGVVTSLEFRLHPYEGQLFRGLWIYRPADAVAVWHAVRERVPTAPRELSLSFVIGRAVPPEEYEPDLAGGPIALVAFSYHGSEADALAAVAPLRDGPSPVMEDFGPKRYLDIQGVYDDEYAWGQRYYCWGAFANDLRDHTIEQLVSRVADVPGDPGFSASAQGGAISDLDEAATAFAGRSAMYRTIAESVWNDPHDDVAAIEWARGAMAIAEPDSVARRYVNEVFEPGTDLSTVYGPEKLARLTEIKRAWDPDNVFRSNHNIAP